MSDIRLCSTHGTYADQEDCPVCHATGEVTLTADNRRRLSKFVSGLLRHFPDDYDISLDDRGWADFERVCAVATGKYGWADADKLTAVVNTDPKGRFELDGDRIRAAYGHSVDVDVEHRNGTVPDTLYHGTAPENLDNILEDGLKPMSRQRVHLTDSVEEAREVALRHADETVILEIDASGMLATGKRVEQSGKTVYTTAEVPPDFISTTV